MNNFEKIKAMSMHKLTKFIKLLRESYCSEWDKPHTAAPCIKCLIKDLCYGIPNTTYSIKQWLQQESNPVEGSDFRHHNQNKGAGIMQDRFKFRGKRLDL